MAALKPRAGSGPLEVEKEGRVYVMRVPVDGGDRVVVTLDATEAADLGRLLVTVSDDSRSN